MKDEIKVMIIFNLLLVAALAAGLFSEKLTLFVGFIGLIYIYIKGRYNHDKGI